jgi:hypothetical protein
LEALLITETCRLLALGAAVATLWSCNAVNQPADWEIPAYRRKHSL